MSKNKDIKNQIINIQEILMRQMERLDDDDTMNAYGEEEIARSGVISKAADTYLKAVNTSLKIFETAKNNSQTTEELIEELGIRK